MATYTVDKIEYNSNVYVLQDSGALQLTGGNVTGPVTFGDTITVDDATLGTMVVNGHASFTNGISGDLVGNVTGNVTGTASGNLTSSSTLNAAKLSGAIPSVVTATTQSSSDNSTKIATTAYVTTAITNLPEPMIFKGSVGTGGTITSLPAAATANEGYTYKVITALTTPVTAKVGDTVISNGSAWTVIPSGDEPSGTVTSIAAGAGLNTTSNDTATDGGTITSSGTLYLTKSGATAGSYGPSANAEPGYGSTFNVPYLTVDKYGRVTAVSTKTVKIPASDNTNTTYTLTNALSSHKFTWTFTAGGSGSGSTTTTAELVQGTNITLTDDTSNKKITIAAKDTTYSAGTGISLSGTTFSNSGVRAVTQGNQNNIKVNTNGTETQVPVYLDTTHINPISTKTFTGVIATAATDAACHMYYMKVVPDSYAGQWFIRYRVNATIDGVSVADGSGFEESEVYIFGMRNTYAAYRTWNNVSNTSYRPYYYHTFYRAKEAGISYGHLLGVSLRYAYNCTTAANTRNITFEILEYGGCTPSFFDSALIYANVPGTGTTNYEGNTTFDATTNGNTMSGDRNDPNTNNRFGYTYRKPYTTLYRYQILLSRPDGTLLPVNSVDNAPSNTEKTLTTEEFDPLGGIYYYNTTTTRSTSQNIDNNVIYRQILADLRYSFNITNASGKCLTSSQPVYIVATLQSNGMAKLASPALTQTLPNSDDGKLYIYIGNAYPDTYPYRSELVLYPIVYWYKNGAVRQYGGDAATVGGKTVGINVPSNAVFTDSTVSTLTLASGSTAGTALSHGGKYTLTAGTKTVSFTMPSAPSVPTSAASATTGITASTTATKTTLGTAFSIPNVTSVGSASTWAFEDVACDDITNWSAGSASTWAFTGVTAATGTINADVSGEASDTLTISLATTTIQSKSSGGNSTAPSLSYTAKTASHVKSGGNGTAPTLGTAFTVPNVTGNTSATVSITDPGHTHTLS